MTRRASSVILLGILLSLCFAGISLAQATDPYYTPPPPPASTSPGESPSPTNTTPSPGATSPSPGTTSPGTDTPGPGISPDVVEGGGFGKPEGPGLDEELPEQRGVTVPGAPAGGVLPFTGAGLVVFILAGLGATAVGVGILRRSRRSAP